MDLLLIDMDGTLTRKDNLIMFTSYMIFSKKIHRFFIGYLLMFLLKLKIIDNIKFKIYYAKFIFKNMSVEILDDYFNEYLGSPRFKQSLNKDVLNWINNNTHSKKVLLSANYEFLVKSIANLLSIPNIKAIELEQVNGKYTGSILGLIPYGPNKVIIADKIFHDSLYKRKLAMGDNQSDIPLLKWADTGLMVKNFPNLKTKFINIT